MRFESYPVLSSLCLGLMNPFVSFILSLSVSHIILTGLSENMFPEGYRLSFPVRSTSMYATVKQGIPALPALTACMWIKPAKSILGTVASYAVTDQSHEFVLQQLVHGPIELIINNEVEHHHIIKFDNHVKT